MAFSMTGIGHADIEKNNYHVNVEIRSVNNRYLDISCKLPSILLPFEQKIRDLIKSKIKRGKIHLIIAGDMNVEPENFPTKINRLNVKAVAGLLEVIREEAGVEEKPKLEHFLNFSEIFEPIEKREIDEGLWEAANDAVEKALDHLIEMRKAEGLALSEDLSERINEIENSITEIEKFAKLNAKEAFARMRQRVEALVNNVEIDKDRLYTEIVIIADKLDITEECVRMRSHLKIFIETLRNTNIVGKKLNFILQEMHREVNTISSKASNFKINHIVIELKEQIEKMREQVQNLE
ncbi:YicC family protein [bacterium]|nr:YicC family protein [bacterium]